MEDQVRFYVNGKFYTLSVKEIEEFPIENSYLALLLRNHRNKNVNVKLHEGAIIIKAPNSSLNIDFDLIVNIYKNPNKSLYEHLNLKQLFTEIRNANDRVDIVRNSPQYKQIRIENFKKLFELFELFMIDTLFYSKIDSYYSDEVVKRIKHTMKNMFSDKCITASHITKPAFHFINSMRQIGALMSGSFVLKHILDEKWTSTDIDLYVHEDLLFSQLGASWTAVNNLNPLMTLFDWRYPREYRIQQLKDSNLNKMYEKYDSLEAIQNAFMKGIADHVCELFGGKDVQVLEKATEGNYNLIKGFRRVIRFQYYGFKVDLCLLSITPQYFIQDFDFDFNKCYFDGHVVHHLKPKSLYTRMSLNHYESIKGHVGHGAKGKFIGNLNRIEKYWERGFYVCPETQVYKTHKRNMRRLKQMDKNSNYNDEMHPDVLMELTGDDSLEIRALQEENLFINIPVAVFRNE